MAKNNKFTKINMRELQQLPLEERKKEYAKLAKRANRRIDRLEESGLFFNSPAYDKLNNETFSRATKNLTSLKETNQALRDVISFLNDKTSTIEGARAYKPSPAERYDNFTVDLRYLTKEEKIQVSQDLAKVANSRMATLEKNGVDYYAYEIAQTYLERQDRNRFYTGSNFNSERELNQQIRELGYFLRSKSSTMRGLHAIEDKRIETFNNKFKEREIMMDELDDDGNVIGQKLFQITKENKRQFFDFLKSEEFKTISKEYDSNQILEDLSEQFLRGVSPEQITKDYQHFINTTNMTFEQVNERRPKNRQNKMKW